MRRVSLAAIRRGGEQKVEPAAGTRWKATAEPRLEMPQGVPGGMEPGTGKVAEDLSFGNVLIYKPHQWCSSH